MRYIQPIRLFFVGFNLCQRIFFNKVAGTVHVHPLKLSIYTLASISFKPFAFSKLNVTCNYKKSLIFNGRLRQTRYDFLTKKLRKFILFVCCNCPKACLKLEVNKTQSFIAPCFSSLYREHYVKSKRKFYAHSLLESLWMKKVIIYNFWLQSDKDSIFSIKGELHCNYIFLYFALIGLG